MTRSLTKFGIFAVIMIVLTCFLFMAFSGFRSGPTNSYSAVFIDASSLKSGDSVRVAGVRVGTVTDVSLQPDNTVVATFNADRDVVLTDGTKLAVRYLNLIGDRYLELLNSPGTAKILPRGSRIPQSRTAPALDLDVLLGGLKPVIRGLNPQDVNALTAALLKIFQGEGDTLNSLFAKTSSFTNTLADNDAATERLIDNLTTVLDTLQKNSNNFSGTIDRFQKLVSQLAADRDPIGADVDALSRGTASLSDLLTNVRKPLAGTIDQLSRLAPLVDQDKGLIDAALQKAPENYRKLGRVGSYGSFVNYYICGIAVRVSDLQGRTAVFPWVKQENGRCAEP